MKLSLYYLAGAMGLGYLLASHIIFIVTFIFAYINDYKVLVLINSYGEAVPELILLILSIWPIAVFLIWVYRKQKGV